MLAGRGANTGEGLASTNCPLCPPVCSVDKTLISVKENTEITGPLVNISIPDGQDVILGPLSTPSTFQILGNQLFLKVIPDYEVQAAGWGSYGEYLERVLGSGLCGMERGFESDSGNGHSRRHLPMELGVTDLCGLQENTMLEAHLECRRDHTMVSPPYPWHSS